MLKLVRLALLLAALLTPALAERVFDVDGPVELYIWLTAKPGQEAAMEKTFREVFYPAVSSRPGFRSASMVRKPGTAEYTVRLSFVTEEARVEWVASDPHQIAWPALESHAAKADYAGFAVIHPK
jgi:heme-degrading monooxygenase HmoA